MIICARPNWRFPFEENILIFKRLGYKHTRFDLKFVPQEKKQQCMDVFREYYDLVRKSGMDFAEFHSFAARDIDSFKRKSKLELEMMKLCGAKAISQHLTDEFMKYPDAINAVIKRYKDAGISFCVENLLRDMRFSTLEDVDAILSKLPDACIAFDVGHAIITGIDLCDFYDKYKEKIKVIHLHDVVETDHSVPFTGILRKSPFISRLKEFKGVVVLEICCRTPEEIAKNFKEAQQNIEKFLLK